VVHDNKKNGREADPFDGHQSHIDKYSSYSPDAIRYVNAEYGRHVCCDVWKEQDVHFQMQIACGVSAIFGRGYRWGRVPEKRRGVQPCSWAKRGEMMIPHEER
jgi:hypothetical protein